MSHSSSSGTQSTFFADVDLVAKAAMIDDHSALSQQFETKLASFTLPEQGHNTS